MLADSLHNAHGCSAAEAGLGFAGHQQGVHEGLRVVLANAHQQVVNRAPHRLHRRVDPRYHLHSAVDWFVWAWQLGMMYTSAQGSELVCVDTALTVSRWAWQLGVVFTSA